MDKAERESLRSFAQAAIDSTEFGDYEWYTGDRMSVSGRDADYVAALKPQILLGLLDHIDALEQQTQIIRELAAPTYSDEKVFALTEYHEGRDWPRNKLHAFGIRAKAAIAAAPEPQ